MEIKTLFRAVILLLVIAFCLKSVVWGENGFLKYLQLDRVIVKGKARIIKVSNDIIELERKIDEWASSDFALEKMAREDLQMGLANEKVYILG